jgi:transcriptional regulator with XRE-family HTH domain
MATKLGKEIRKLRMERKETIVDMGKKLDLSISFLSAIENGVKKVPKNFLDKLASIYGFDDITKNKYKKYLDESISEVKVDLTHMNEIQRQMVIMLAREKNDYDKEKYKKLLQKLLEVKNE